MVTLKPQSSKIDTILLCLVLGLTVFGILMVYEASSVTAFRDFGDKFFYVRQQFLGAFLGFGVLFVFSRLNYQRLKNVALLFLLLTIFFLILVLIPGVGIKALGARRWLNFLGFNFQPGEMAKLSFVLYFSFLFSQKPKFLPFLLISFVFLILLILEPDLGTAIILLSSGLSVYFVAGAPLFLFFITTILSIVIGLILVFSSSYRKERFLSFLSLGNNLFETSYHVRQVILSLGAGGLWGVGLGASRQKYEYLPEAMTDSIFAIIAEELGFIGATALIIIFLIVIYRGIKISQEAPDRFGQLLAVGITCWIGIQALINLSSQVALVPLTGVPLPFVSYGGSSLVVCLWGIGILLNISKHKVARK